MSNLKAIFQTGLTTVAKSTDKKDDVGDIRIEGGSIYKYVKFLHGTSTVDVTLGDVVVYTGSTGYVVNTVSADYSDGGVQELGAGVVQALVTTDAVFMWVQIKGPATLVETIGNTATDGSPLTAFAANDKALNLIVASTLPGVQCALAYDASAKTIICDFPW